MLTLPNYQIGTQIYESVNSLVYRGHRNKDNQPVILKMLKQDYPTPLELTRYRQEYEITHDFDLVGVIKAYGIEKYQNTLVIILEDFGGESLKQLIANQPLTLKAFLPIAIQIADSLGHIHAANIIHKDINHSNIVVNPDTSILKIIDFGIASRLPRENPTLKNPEQLEGTLAYLSPEQSGRMNRALDYRTDLYSLGVTFYELLSGKLPFESTDALELVHCHIAKTPKPVCEIHSEVPQILSDIVMKLMAKNVEDRYQSAFGVKADLQKLQLQFAKTAHIEFFKIAQNDFSGKFQIPQKLYGRESEVNTLLQAFERVSQGTTEMMLVAGYSGVGKTALVHEVHKLLTEKHGYFASGKFDQLVRNIPYSALTQAFNMFCNYLLTESTEQLAQWREKILNAVGNNGQVLIDVIPQLELVIGPQPTIASVGPTEAQNRFNLAFQNFFRAICQAKHPLVLFIDDLQWADSASLNLLETLMTDTEGHYFLIIGAYRDNEVDAAHPLMIRLKDLKKAQVTVKTISLPNLSYDDVNTLTADALGTEPSDALAFMVYEKTQGNSFFTHEFLKSLYQQKLLFFDFQKRQWDWDLTQIKAQNITDNVIDLMVAKFQKLNEKTQNILKLAACIGNQFEIDTLAIVCEQNVSKTKADLWEALTEELVLPLEDSYKFVHDRIQQTVYSLIQTEQKQAVHWQVGQLLLKNTSPERREQSIFAIVDQLDAGIELATEQSERYEIAQLNLIAGQKAKSSTAYQPAFNYLSVGIKLLGKMGWQTQYDLILALHVEAAEAAYLSNHFEPMEQLVEVVLQQANTLLDKVQAYEIKILSYMAQNRMLDAIKIGLQVLKLLGVSLPNRPNTLHIILSLLETKFIVGRKRIDDLVNLPEMSHPDRLAAMRILARITSAAYIATPKLFPLIVFKQVNLSIKQGNTTGSAYAYATYGLVLCHVVGDIKTGYQFGQLALTLLEKSKIKEIRAKTLFVVNNLIRHWKEHAKELLKPLLDAYQSGLETGDLEFANYAVVNYPLNSYLIGRELTAIEQELNKYSNIISQLKQESGIHMHYIFRQVILNVIKPIENPGTLMGEEFDEEKMLPVYLESNNINALCYLYCNKLILCYLFHAYPQAVENAILTEKYLEGMVGFMFVPIFHFYDSLARIAMFHEVQKPEQKNIFKKIATNQKKMKQWAHHAPMNHLHKFYLVEAERCRVLGKDGEAREFYDKAIAKAHENEYLNEEALAHELAGQFYLAKGLPQIAQVYLREAHYAYQQWGALAKVKDLETRYPQFLAPKTARAISMDATISGTRMASTSTTGSSECLDLNSIMKAAQTLSGEIVLSRLLEKMMHIVIENAGASIGFLLLPKQDSWFIEAQGQVDSDEVKVLQSFPIENQPVAETIIHYVIRTQENVVLNNASIEGQFTRDPYIVKQHPKSVLCAPLINQSKLSGLLYLENNLTTGAFTPERIKVLNLLSSQIAISIENARLYTSITRFLPNEFLSLLDKKNIIDVQLGDQVEKEMSILFADIRDFTSLSEKMTPQENFNFINAYLGRMETVITQHHGFIDKYIGDAIMALFSANADEAVSASCAMLKKLATINQERQESSLEPIAIGIGLNTGLLMLGTVGGENRMDGTVISDAVNLASRIEGMTKKYGAALLISEETYAHLNDPSQYGIRTIDRVKVKGKSEPVTVYEVFDGDAAHLAELKTITRDDFEKGLAHYRQKTFTEAILCFEQVLRTHPDDKAAQIYLGRCQHWQKVGVPDDWEGVEALDSK